MPRILQRLAARYRTWRSIDDVLKRRAAVEQYLLDCAGGKRPLPDAQTCQLLVLKLSIPTGERKINLPRNQKQ